MIAKTCVFQFSRLGPHWEGEGLGEDWAEAGWGEGGLQGKEQAIGEFSFSQSHTIGILQ